MQKENGVIAESVCNLVERSSLFEKEIVCEAASAHSENKDEPLSYFLHIATNL